MSSRKTHLSGGVDGSPRLKEALRQKNLLLVMGKGGVGRTTTAATLALAAAQGGRSTLLLEVGSQDGEFFALKELFHLPKLDAKPRPVRPNLSAAVLDGWHGLELLFQGIVRVPAVAKALVGRGPLRHLLTTMPSFYEIGVVNYLNALRETQGPHGGPLYDLIVVDMPATGHGLAIFEALDEALVQFGLNPVTKVGARYMADLRNQAKAGVVVVTLPEVLPVNETMELLDRIHRFQVAVDSVVVNKWLDPNLDPGENGLLRHLYGAGSFLGASRFHSLEERRRAKERLQSIEPRSPLSFFPESEAGGASLVEHLAKAMDTIPSMTPMVEARRNIA